MNVIGTIVGLALLLPYIAAAVRRLHDTNGKGLWLFLLLIPIIGKIWVLVLMYLKGSKGENTLVRTH